MLTALTLLVVLIVLLPFLRPKTSRYTLETTYIGHPGNAFRTVAYHRGAQVCTAYHKDATTSRQLALNNAQAHVAASRV